MKIRLFAKLLNWINGIRGRRVPTPTSLPTVKVPKSYGLRTIPMDIEFPYVYQYNPDVEGQECEFISFLPETTNILMLHCTATPPHLDVTTQMLFDWWKSPPPRGNGWRNPGYNEFVTLSGETITLVPQNLSELPMNEWAVVNGAAGMNQRARHYAYAGGVDQNGQPKDTRNQAQLVEMVRYIKEMIRRHPNIKIAGHNQFSSKACPSFCVPTWLRSIGIREDNIWIA